MGSIGRYIFRTTFGAFLVICASVTALMWITQALRDIDLMTNQGQSIFVFIGITGLIVPLLVLIIAPIALMIAVAHVLNKLGNDSELIVMNAAGMPPWVLFRPFLAVGSRRLAAGCRDQHLRFAMGTARIAALGDRGSRRSRFEHRAARPLHQARRAADAAHPRTAPQRTIAGHLIDDQRNPKERASILAEQGDIVKNERGPVPRPGERQRAAARDRAARSRDRAVQQLRFRPVVALADGKQSLKYSVRERYLWELFDPDADRHSRSPTSRIRSGPNFTTGSPPRFTRSPSSC